MKFIAFAFALFFLLGACIQPATTVPSGAVSFSQVLAENEGRPYECSRYDAETDSCVATATYREISSGVYQFAGTILIDTTMPPILISGTVEERGMLVCTDFRDISIRSVDGTQSPPNERLFAQLENAYAGIGETCSAYISSGRGYLVRLVSGSALALRLPDEPSRFFSDRKTLRFDPQ